MLRQVLRSLFAPRAGPDAAALNEQGIALWQTGDLTAAEARFRQTLARDAAHAAACSNLGMVLAEQRRFDEALAQLTRAVELDPGHAGARVNLANALHFDGQIDAALAHYLEALRLAPDAPAARVNALKPLMDACQWTEVEQAVAELAELQRGAPESRWAERVTPFVSQLLPLPADFRRRLAIHHASGLAARWAAERPRIAALRPAAAGKRIRIGYLSGDFRNHALGHLACGLFELHDRDRFEVFAYSFGPDDGSRERRRIAAGVDRFIDISAEPFAASAERIARDGIEVLVDLAGYSGASRSEILAMRPAPAQAHWLGFPGTMGADFIDWLFADRVALPDASEAQFTEAIVRLPGSFVVADSAQPIAPAPASRAEAGLPAEGFVFCCFNQTCKIDRAAFVSWMRVLRAVPGALLWLIASSDLARSNLRRAAEREGIDPARLVFAPTLAKDRHLARLRLADLHLDTRTVSGGTTAVDALWAGVPLLSCAGEALGGRVAASVLAAAGLADLVASGHSEGERLAVELALDPARLAAIRARVAGCRDASALFDTGASVAALERAFERMHGKARSGRRPASFDA